MMMFAVMVTLMAGAPEQPAERPLVVAVSEMPPFVIKEGDRYTGYDIELLEAIMREHGKTVKYLPTDGIKQSLLLAADDRVDLAIGAISITYERERHVDFTYPSYKSGLGLVVNPDRLESPGWSWGRFTSLGLFVLLILVVSHVVWFLERGNPSFPDEYVKGVSEGVYFAVVTASTVGYGDKTPARPQTKAAVVIAILFSLPLFAYFTADMTAAMTVSDLKSQIHSPADLHVKVGVVEGTTSVDAVAKYKVGAVLFKDNEALFKGFESGDVDAMIYDAPVLKHYVRTRNTRAEMAGSVFDPQDLGFVVKDPDIRENINRALLAMRESGAIQRLKTQWFGSD